MATQAIEKLERLLEEVFAMGFDRSVVDDDHVHIGCSQCEALCINGMATHETGCRNQPWECRECGAMIPKGQSCNCLDELDDEPEGAGWDFPSEEDE